MYVFLIKNDELLGKYNKIWNKVSNDIKKGFDREPVYNEKCLKPKIKSYEGKITTNFLDNGVPKVPIVFFYTGKNYYPQVFLGEFKYIVKEKKINKYLKYDIEMSSDDSAKE